MFAPRYFAVRFFAPRYFPPGAGVVIPVVRALYRGLAVNPARLLTR